MAATASRTARGRPPKFRREFIDQSRIARAEFGADDDAVARFLSVDVSTLRRWKNAHPGFRAAMSEAPPSWDRQIARAMHGARGKSATRLPPQVADAITRLIAAVASNTPNDAERL